MTFNPLVSEIRQETSVAYFVLESTVHQGSRSPLTRPISCPASICLICSLSDRSVTFIAICYTFMEVGSGVSCASLPVTGNSQGSIGYSNLSNNAGVKFLTNYSFDEQNNYELIQRLTEVDPRSLSGLLVENFSLGVSRVLTVM